MVANDTSDWIGFNVSAAISWDFGACAKERLLNELAANNNADTMTERIKKCMKSKVVQDFKRSNRRFYGFVMRIPQLCKANDFFAFVLF